MDKTFKRCKYKFIADVEKEIGLWAILASLQQKRTAEILNRATTNMLSGVLKAENEKR